MKTFCVIAPSVNGAVPRTWRATEQEAVEHAANILNDARRGGRIVPAALYVVEIKKVVRPATPPIEVLNPEDIQEASDQS